MSVIVPYADHDWLEASVPGTLTDGTAVSEPARQQIVEFLRAASDAKLKPAELAAHASEFIQAWVKEEPKGKCD